MIKIQSLDELRTHGKEPLTEFDAFWIEEWIAVWGFAWLDYNSVLDTDEDWLAYVKDLD